MCMEITPYVEEMAAGLRVALAAQTEPQLADKLAAAAQAPARLALMGAVSQAAAEASASLPSGRIGVQLAGPDLVLAYEPDLSVPNESNPTTGDTTETEDDGQARLTLRLPASIKTKAEQAAAEQGISLNTWVVRALRDATDTDRFDLRVGPVGLRVHQSSGNRIQGWV